MRKLKLILSWLGLGVLALAQTNTLTTTTLSAAVSAPVGTPGITYITVASATGINGPSMGNGPFGGTQGTVGTLLYVDKEAMQVQSVSGTTIAVWRGYAGTRATAHQSGALVWIGNPEWYSSAPIGSVPSGTCTLGTLNAYPDIHILDGTWWGCTAEGVWGFAGPGLDAYGAILNRTKVTTTYTAKIYDYILALDSTGGAFTLTLPSATSVPGKVLILKDEGADAGTNNITLSPTVAGCTFTANNASCRLYSNGTSWFAW